MKTKYKYRFGNIVVELETNSVDAFDAFITDSPFVATLMSEKMRQDMREQFKRKQQTGDFEEVQV